MKYVNTRSRIHTHSDHVAEIAAGRRPYPINVEIDLSNRCSLGCSWCHFAHTHVRGPLVGSEKPDNYEDTGDQFDQSVLYKTLLELDNAGVKSVTWSGGGEPTLYPWFNDTLLFASLETNLAQGIYTHGGHIDEDRARLMKERMSWVYISLDANTAAAYSTYKGVHENRFRKVMDGIKRLVAAEGDATIGLGYLVGEHNFGTVEDAVALAKQLEVDYIQFRPIILFENNDQGQIRGSTTWIDPFLKNVSSYYADPFVQVDTQRFLMYRYWTGHQYTSCHWSTLQTVITPDASVWTCVNKRGFDGECLGNLTKESFSEIWARAKTPDVNETCRVMCKGHLGNVELQNVLGEDSSHPEFI